MAKAFIINASALTGRFALDLLHPGRCPGLGASAPSGRTTRVFLTHPLLLHLLYSTFTSPLWYYRQQPFRRP